MGRMIALAGVFLVGAGSGAGGTFAWMRGQEPPLAQHAAGMRSAVDSARADSASADSVIAAPAPLLALEDTSALAADTATPPVPDSAAAVFDSLATSVPALAGARPLTPRRIAKVFGAMQPRDAAQVLGRLGDPQIQLVLGMLGDRQVAAILTALGPDRAAALSGAVLPTARTVR